MAGNNIRRRGCSEWVYQSAAVRDLERNANRLGGMVVAWCRYMGSLCCLMYRELQGVVYWAVLW